MYWEQLEKKKCWLLGALALADFLLLYFFIAPYVDVNPYFLRDLRRAQEWLHGYPVWQGPDNYSGGYAFGPFFYWFLAPVLLLTTNLSGMIAIFLSLKVGIQLVLSEFLARRMEIPAYLAYLLFSASAFFTVNFLYLNNSSFIYVFLPVLTILLDHYHRGCSSLWFGVALGLAAQVHISFLYCLFFFFVVAQAKNTSYRSLLRDLGICLGCILLCSVPFLWAIQSGVPAPTFTAETLHFWTHLKKTWVWMMGSSARGSLNINSFEVYAVYAYLCLKAIFVIRKPLRSWTLTDRLLLVALALALFHTGWVFARKVYRYNTIWFFVALLFLQADLALLWKKRAARAPALVLALLLAGFTLKGIVAPEEYGTKNSWIVAADAAEVCRYFNEQKIGFETFVESTYELMAINHEDSFGTIRFCFKNPGTNSAKSPWRYLLVAKQRLLAQGLADLIETIPAEVRNLYVAESKEQVLETKNFFLFRLASSTADSSFQRATNLSFVYELDPALNLTRQLRVIGDQFSRRNQLGTYNVSEIKFCEVDFYCSVYAFHRYENGQLYLRLVSRIFQTKWDLPPVFGNLKTVRLQYTCDGKSQHLDLLSLLGADQEFLQLRSLFTPFEYRQKLNCSRLELQALIVGESEIFVDNLRREPQRNMAYEFQRVNILGI